MTSSLEPWFVLSKDRYETMLNDALAEITSSDDVRHEKMTSSDDTWKESMMPSDDVRNAPTKECSELTKLLNHDDDLKDRWRNVTKKRSSDYQVRTGENGRRRLVLPAVRGKFFREAPTPVIRRSFENKGRKESGTKERSPQSFVFYSSSSHENEASINSETTSSTDDVVLIPIEDIKTEADFDEDEFRQMSSQQQVKCEIDSDENHYEDFTTIIKQMSTKEDHKSILLNSSCLSNSVHVAYKPLLFRSPISRKSTRIRESQELLQESQEFLKRQQRRHQEPHSSSSSSERFEKNLKTFPGNIGSLKNQENQDSSSSSSSTSTLMRTQQQQQQLGSATNGRTFSSSPSSCFCSSFSAVPLSRQIMMSQEDINSKSMSHNNNNNDNDILHEKLRRLFAITKREIQNRRSIASDSRKEMQKKQQDEMWAAVDKNVVMKMLDEILDGEIERMVVDHDQTMMSKVLDLSAAILGPIVQDINSNEDNTSRDIPPHRVTRDVSGYCNVTDPISETNEIDHKVIDDARYVTKRSSGNDVKYLRRMTSEPKRKKKEKEKEKKTVDDVRVKVRRNPVTSSTANQTGSFKWKSKLLLRVRREEINPEAGLPDHWTGKGGSNVKEGTFLYRQKIRRRRTNEFLCNLNEITQK